MKMKKTVKIIFFFAGIWLITLFSFRVINTDKVAVIVTDWGQPEGFSDSYYQGIAQRSRIGIQAASADQVALKILWVITPTVLRWGATHMSALF